MTNELIKVTTNEEGRKLVSARELHELLITSEGKQERFSQWFNRHLQYGFEENVDFTSVKIFTVVNNGAKRELDDYAMSIDMAKELAMLQKSIKGRMVRNYFIKCEKELLSTKLDSYMINDPVERAKRWIEEYEEKKALLELTQQQALTIEEQEVEIEHKEDVIVTLVEDVDLMTKRQRITQIVKYGSNGRFSERWSLLYKEFETKYHIDVNRRMKRAKENGTFKKSGSKLEYICDIMGMTSQLFDVCVVVFEADYKEMLQYYLDVAQGK